MAATKIKGILTYCEIKDVAISKEEATLKVVFFSNQENIVRFGLRFYIEDLDLKTISLLSSKYYWVDRFQATENENQWENNIDINLYKEVIIKVNIRNNNLSTFTDGKWYRNIRLLIKADDIIGTSSITEGDTVWFSQNINLVSNKIKIPDIKHIEINCFDVIDDPDKHLEEVAVIIYYDYGIETDFNYVNSNIQYHFKLINPYVMRTINKKILVENGVYDQDERVGIIKYTFTNQKLRRPVLVNITIRNLKGDEIKSYTKQFVPFIPKSRVYVKENNTSVKVNATFIAGDNPDLLYINVDGYDVKQ
jgi:hypothetical protein